MTRVKSQTNNYLNKHIGSIFRGRLKPEFNKSQIKIESSLARRYNDLKRKKRVFREEFIKNINSIAKFHNIRYSNLIHRLNIYQVLMNRKSISNMSISENRSIKSIIYITST